MKTRVRSGWLPLGAVLLVSIFVGAAACSNEYDPNEPTPTCTPPTAIDLTVTLAGSNATAYAGNPAALRILINASSNPSVASCTTTLVNVTGGFALTGGAFGPIGETRAELVVSSDANTAFADGDLTYTFERGVDGTSTGGPCDVDQGWDLSVDVATAPQSPVTWTPGLSCPGE